MPSRHTCSSLVSVLIPAVLSGCSLVLPFDDLPCPAGSTPCGSVCIQAGKACTSGALSAYRAAVRADGPIAYYPLDESASPVVDDVGELTGNAFKLVTFGEPGALGDGDKAVHFRQPDADHGYIDFGPHFRFDGGAAFTIELWARPDELSSSYARIVSMESDVGGRQGYLIYAQDGNQPSPYAFEFYRDDQRVGVALSSTPLQQNVYQHVVARFDGTTMSLFVDATPVGMGTPSQTLPVHDGHFNCGRNGAYPGEFFTGAIDELAIFDKALTDGQIQTHFAAARPP